MFCCHSGTLSGRFPPNSLAAVAECVEAGVPRLEIDVRFMEDDAMLIFHDGALDRSTTGAGRVAGLSRADVTHIRYRADESHGLCFLEEVVDIVRGSATMLQVDLKLMRPMSATRASALQAVLRPLGSNLVVGSQAHWNLRRLNGLPVAFDPTLQWNYDPGRQTTGVPHTLGVHGFWDDSPLAGIPHASPADYLESRIEDILALLPNAVEWMVDIQTVLRMGELGLALGERLGRSACALAAWTLHDSPDMAATVSRLFELGAETVITDAPVAAAGAIARPSSVNRL